MFNANGLFGPEAWRKTHASWDLVFLLDKALDILAGSEASYRKLASFKGIADLVIGHRGDANGGREVSLHPGLQLWPRLPPVREAEGKLGA